jgi:STE24 endopeptidase
MRLTMSFLSHDDAKRAKRYNRLRLAVLVGSTLWSALGKAWLASDRRAARLKEAVTRASPQRRLVAPAFIALMTAISWLMSLLVSFFGGYQVERRFGLTKQSGWGWLADQLKGLAVALILQTPLLTAAFAVIRRRPRDWWLVLSAATVPLAVIFSNLAPVLLMPLFNRFEALSDRDLAERVRELARRAGVRISDVYQMDMSRQSEKPNAFFAGLGNTKRIVLGDTLLERFDDDEIAGVVAHELGHQAHGDIWRLIGFAAGAGFLLAWAMSRLAPAAVRRTNGETGVTEIGDEAALPVLAMLMTALGFILMPIQAAFSRAIERRTDRYAVALTRDGEAYARAMEKLGKASLADPDPSPAVVFMLYSHPPIGERVRAARGGAALSG